LFTNSPAPTDSTDSSEVLQNRSRSIFNCPSIGLIIAFVTFAIDQVVKIVLLSGLDIEDKGPFHITSFLDFILVWNRGISYGWFGQEGDLLRYFIIVVTFSVLVMLSVWLFYTEKYFTASGLGFLIGGGAGNMVDRILYGAVADYVHLFLPDMSFSWYVFNLADVWISIGAVLVLYQAIVTDS